MDFSILTRRKNLNILIVYSGQRIDIFSYKFEEKRRDDGQINI